MSHLKYPKAKFDVDNDQEFAHLNTNVEKCLQYVGSSPGHEFMLQETIDPKAYTYKLFEKNEEGQYKEYLYVADAPH